MGETPADPLSTKALSPKALAIAFAKALGRDGLTPLEQSLAAQAYEDYRKDELPGLTAPDLACNLARSLSFAAKRPGRKPKISASLA